MKTLVQIPGTEVWVNPRYVTSVAPGYADGPDTKTTGKLVMGVCVQYEGNAGYRTKETSTTASMAAVLFALNQDVAP